MATTDFLIVVNGEVDFSSEHTNKSLSVYNLKFDFKTLNISKRDVVVKDCK